MNKKNQSGRSMLIMLAVLALIAFVGSKGKIYLHKVQIYKEAFNILTLAQKHACDYNSEEYASYAQMLSEEGLVRLAYANGKLLGSDGLTYQFIENKREHFILRISGLDWQKCRDLGMEKWWDSEAGEYPLHGYPEISINKSKPFTLVTKSGADALCRESNDNTIRIGSDGCVKKKKEK
jgi:hypothetical protein